jgi:hypothetical protein
VCTGLKSNAVCQILCWLQKKSPAYTGLLSDIGCFVPNYENSQAGL